MSSDREMTGWQDSYDDEVTYIVSDVIGYDFEIDEYECMPLVKSSKVNKPYYRQQERY